jgi:hypothetical protein
MYDILAAQQLTVHLFGVDEDDEILSTTWTYNKKTLSKAIIYESEHFLLTRNWIAKNQKYLHKPPTQHNTA